MQHYHKKISYRHSIRLSEFDYAKAGMYFVTICTQNRNCIFGEITNGIMQMNTYGQVVAEEWLKTAQIRQKIKLYEFVVMPNHFHGIIHIMDDLILQHNAKQQVLLAGRSNTLSLSSKQLTTSNGPKTQSIGALLAGFKSAVTAQIRIKSHIKNKMVWHRKYYEHVIRDDADYLRLAEYINTNPQRWNKDRFYREDHI